MKKDAPSLQEFIRIEAYLLSEKAGHPSGMDEFFWIRAEAIVHGRTAVLVGPGKLAKAKPKAASRNTGKSVKKIASTKVQPVAKSDKTAKSKTKPAAKRAK